MSTLSFEAALSFGSRGEGLGGVSAVLFAAGLHVGLGLVALTLPRTSESAPVSAMEVEMAAWQAPSEPELANESLAEPEPEPAPEPEPDVAEPRPTPAPVARERVAAPVQDAEPPPAAHAGALLTATAEPAPGATPVRFVSDPSGASFGFGVVARGGTATHGAIGAAVGGQGQPGLAPAAQPGGHGPAITPASELSRPPRLEQEDVCRGHFPSTSRVDQGVVTLRVVVQPGGATSRVSVERESPPDEGFGQAARVCLRSARFTPALGVDGTPTTAAARVTIRFSR